MDRVLGSGSGHPALPCWVPLCPGALLHWPARCCELGGGIHSERGWRGKHQLGGCCGSSWSDLGGYPTLPRECLPHVSLPPVSSCKVRQDVGFGRSSGSELSRAFGRWAQQLLETAVRLCFLRDRRVNLVRSTYARPGAVPPRPGQ